MFTVIFFIPDFLPKKNKSKIFSKIIILKTDNINYYYNVIVVFLSKTN